jgi:hypothetical protein
MPIVAMQGGAGSFTYGEFTSQGGAPASVYVAAVGGGGFSGYPYADYFGYTYSGGGAGGVGVTNSMSGFTAGTSYTCVVGGFGGNSYFYGPSYSLVYGTGGGSASSYYGGSSGTGYGADYSSSAYSGAGVLYGYDDGNITWYVGGGGGGATGGGQNGYSGNALGGSGYTLAPYGINSGTVSSGGNGSGSQYFDYYYGTGTYYFYTSSIYGGGGTGYPFSYGTSPGDPGLILLSWLTSSYPGTPTYTGGHAISTSGSYTIMQLLTSGSLTF